LKNWKKNSVWKNPKNSNSKFKNEKFKILKNFEMKKMKEEFEMKKILKWINLIRKIWNEKFEMKKFEMKFYYYEIRKNLRWNEKILKWKNLK
jgi:hypothetical protein